MKVDELMSIRNSNIPNSEKGKMIARMLKARAKQNNPKEGETPLGIASSGTANPSSGINHGINL